MIHQAEFQQAISFLRPGLLRGKAVVIAGAAGTGKSYLLEQLAQRLEGQGDAAARFFDDVDLTDPALVCEELRAAASDASTMVILAGRDIPAAVMELLDRILDRRLIQLDAMTDVEDVRR